MERLHQSQLSSFSHSSDHKLGGLNDRIYRLTVLEAKCLKSRFWQGWGYEGESGPCHSSSSW